MSEAVNEKDVEFIAAILQCGAFLQMFRGNGKTTAILKLIHDHPGQYAAVFKDERLVSCAMDAYRRLFREKADRGLFLTAKLDSLRGHNRRFIGDEYLTFPREVIEFLHAGVQGFEKSVAELRTPA